MGLGLAITLSVLVPLFIVAGIIAVIVMLVIRSRNPKDATTSAPKIHTDEDGEIMLKNIYIYLVLFATLMMTIGGSVGVIGNIADLVAPNPNIQSYEDFRSAKIRDMNSNLQIIDPNNQTVGTEVETDIRDRYDQMKEEETIDTKRNALRGVIQSLAWIVIPFPVFLYFQRLRNREIKNERHTKTNE